MQGYLLKRCETEKKAIMKLFKTSVLGLLILSLNLIYSCSDEIEQNHSKFDFKAFETYKEVDFVTIPTEMWQEVDPLLKFQKITDLVNTELKTDLEVNALDRSYLRKQEQKEEVNIADFLNENDLFLIEIFKRDLKERDFDFAMQNFEIETQNLGLDSGEFLKYNKIANLLQLLYHKDPEFFDSPKSDKFARGGNPCRDAIISYSFATLGLASCGVNPVLCYFAIANKVRTFKNMVDACQQK